MTLLETTRLLGFAALILNLLLVVKIVFQPAEDRVAKYLLLGLLAGLTAMIATQLYTLMQLYWDFPHYSYSTLLLRYSVGPFLYAYVNRLARGQAPWHQRWWYLHWLLPVAITACFVPYYLQDAGTKLAFFRSEQVQPLNGALGAGYYLHILIYVYFCMGPLREYEQQIVQNFSSLKHISLSWLKKICYGFVLLILLDVALPVTGLVSLDAYRLFLSASALFIVVLAYSALGHSRLQFPLQSSGEDAAPDQVPEQASAAENGTGAMGKYSRSGLREDTARYYLQKLDRLMSAEQCFLDDGLSLGTLAGRLNMSPHHLSQLLNEQLHTTFYDYVNELRIAHARQMLLEHPGMAIIEIACGSGYNNKSTFYTAFRRRVGMTPAQYRRQALTAPSNASPAKGDATSLS